MATIKQKHRDRIATIDNAFTTGATPGVPAGYVVFGQAPEQTLTGTNNLTYNVGTNTLALTGTVNTSGLAAAGATIGSLGVTGSATVAGNTTISGLLNVGGSEILHGILTTGTNSIAATNVQGYVNVTALSAGPVGTWLTTDISGVVNWNAIPNIAAGWTFDGTKIYANAGIPVRINNLSTGSEKLNVGGTSIFQGNLAITTGGATIAGPISVSNGTGTAGQALFSNGTSGTYWSTVGGGFITGTSIADYPPGAFPGGINAYDLTPVTFANGTSHISANPDFVIDNNHGSGNSRTYINYSTRAFTGNETNGASALNVVDAGTGCISAGFASIGIRLFASPPGYSGPALNGGFINCDSNSSKNNAYAFLACQNPNIDGPGQPSVLRATINSDGSFSSFGGLSVFNNIQSNSNCFVIGTLTAGTKHFCIPHPLPELSSKKKLYHTSVESPQANLIYRGRAALSGGKGVVDLDEASRMSPGTINMLANMAGADVFVTNKTSFARVRAEVFMSQLTITCEDDSDIEVAWMVVAERLASTMPSEALGPDGKVLVESDVKES